jgi:hypothetical protein
MRTLAAVLLSGLLLSVAIGADAEPSGKCGTAPAVANPDPNDFRAAVCVAGVGSIEAKDAGSFGYIVADGDSSNPSCLDGYIGIEGDTSGNFNYVASPSGDYDGDSVRNGPPAGNPDPTACLS